MNIYDLSPPGGYGDGSYAAFVNKAAYKNRGTVYVGANDGMLHAFKLGKLDVTPAGDRKATLSGADLGEEQWAFIPKNSLPYLRYLTCKSGNGDAFCANQDYNHLYYLDGTTTIFDASIATPSGCSGDYWDCPKDYTDGSTWRTVLIGGMGLGGASKNSTDSCAEDVSGSCVKTPVTDLGYSSYFALDVTNQTSTSGTVGPPKLLWEFSPDGLGFATTGAATVKISAVTSSKPDNTKNGRWFAVFGSGPTGPISKSNHQFLGASYQPLKIFVVDMNATPPFVQNTNYWVIDRLPDNTQITNAYVSSVSNATIDTDKWNKSSLGFYQDDALYFGYVQRNSATSSLWRTGGVLRLVTGEDPNPANWKLSKVFDGIGPVTTAITRLQDRKNHKLWLYFGTGRYSFAQDDMGSGRRLYAVKEPCYTTGDDLNATCTDKKTPGTLTNQTNSASQTVTNDGWYVDLDGQDTTNSLGAERVITDPVALTNGAVFFTTFKPTSDACQFGGKSYLWATRYDTGLQAPAKALEGKALVQVSTGSFEEINLSTAFTDKGNRRMGTAMTGKPPSDPPPIVSKSNLKPVKRVIHIQEH
jgi:type IV pilus assembly protein PilY1